MARDGHRGRRPKVAIAHDYLTQRGGAERVVLALARAFPDATVHTTMYDRDSTFPEFGHLPVRVTALNRTPLRRAHRAALPVLPFAVARHRIDADLTIASSSGWAHGFPTSGKKLVYCYSPARWLYDFDRYRGDRTRPGLADLGIGLLGPALRQWDRRAAGSADGYLAISRAVRDRIRSAYGVDAEVLPAPVTLTPHGAVSVVPALRDWAAEGYALVVSRLLPYKNVGAVIEAFRGHAERLVVVGNGPLLPELARSSPENVRIVSDLTDAQVRWVYANAAVLVAPSFEDFGLTPLEAAGHGIPTAALRWGGYLDTIDPAVNGEFFEEPTPAAIRAAVRRVRSRTWDRAAIGRHARGFSEERFIRDIRAHVDRLSE